MAVPIDGNEAVARVAHAAILLAHLRQWLEERGYASVREMIGAASQERVADPAGFERANYLATLTRYSSQRLGW